VNDPILLFLTIDAVALLLLGAFGAALPLAACGFLATMATGLGMLLCLPPLLMTAPATVLAVPIGPPGLSLHLALDPLSAFFLVVVFLAATVIAAVQATAVPLSPLASVRTNVLCVAGTALALLAADGVTLALGLAVTCGALWLPGQGRYRQSALLLPLLPLAAVCLLTPAGYAPRFDAIRTAPADPEHAMAAAALIFATFATLAWNRPAERCWTRDALTAGVLIPFGCYLLLRLVADLSGTAAQTGCGFVLLLAGAAAAVIEGWRAARHPDIDRSAASLTRRQADLATAGIGLALIARAADLPGAASFALAASFLTVIGLSVAGVLLTLAVQAIAVSAGGTRLTRLGGLIHTMPAASTAFAAGLLGLAALPPGLGFASLWLLFEAILSAPRTGGLLFQIPLALTGAAIALSAALSTAASIRLVGVALLGRPRSPRGSGANETRSTSRTILLALAGLAVTVGVLPGAVLWLLADPAIRILTGAPPGSPVGLALLLPSAASPSYLALPVFALLALATGAALLVPRRSRAEGKPAGLWADGMAPPVGLPFGDPAAQSAGEGFLPNLPEISLPTVPRLPVWPVIRPPSPTAGLWLMLTAFGALLLVLAMTG
jgi:hydrogenase-4 component B